MATTPLVRRDPRARSSTPPGRACREHGTGAVSVKAIAEAAGVSRQLVYFHFRNRAGLLTAMTRHRDAASGFVARVTAAAALPPAAALEALLRAWCAYLPEILPVARALEAAHVTGDEGGEAWRDRMGGLREVIAAAVDRVARDGGLARGWSAATAADWLWAELQPAAFAHLAAGAAGPPRTTRSGRCRRCSAPCSPRRPMDPGARADPTGMTTTTVVRTASTPLRPTATPSSCGPSTTSCAARPGRRRVLHGPPRGRHVRARRRGGHPGQLREVAAFRAFREGLDDLSSSSCCAGRRARSRRPPRVASRGDDHRSTPWSDIACPWCYIGKRKLEAGIARVPRASIPATSRSVTYHSLRALPRHPGRLRRAARSDFLVQHKGMLRAAGRGRCSSACPASPPTVGLDYDFDALRHTNTRQGAPSCCTTPTAHGAPRLEAQGAADAGLLHRGPHLGRDEDLADLAAEIGLDRDDALRSLRAGEHAPAVEADQCSRRVEYGIHGVPYFVLDRRRALRPQPPEVLRRGAGSDRSRLGRAPRRRSATPPRPG